MARFLQPWPVMMSLWVGFGLGLGSTGAAFAATDPSTLPAATLQANLAAALAIPKTQIVQVQGYALRTANGVSGVVLGRYRESAAGYTFPVLAVYHDCPGGTCQALLRLGQAVDRVTPISLVDLDANAAPVPHLQPVWLQHSVPQPATPPRFPVLLLGSEPQTQDPSKPGSARAGRASEQALHIISLQAAAQPTLLQSLTLAEHWPESEDARERPPRRVGHQIEGVVLGRQGNDHVLIVHERDLDSRYSRGLRPQPTQRTFRLVGGRFVAQPDLSSPFAAPL